MDQQEAVDHLTLHYGTNVRQGGPWRSGGPGVEAVARAVTLEDSPDPTTDDLRAALTLLPMYLSEVEAIQRCIIGAARTTDETGKPRMTWEEIGLLLGYPKNSSKQRAVWLAKRLGLLPKEPVRPRGRKR